MTEIKLKMDDLVVTVRVERGELSLSQLIDDLIVPALLAAGYHPDTIKSYIEHG